MNLTKKYEKDNIKEIYLEIDAASAGLTRKSMHLILNCAKPVACNRYLIFLDGSENYYLIVQASTI